MNPHRVVPGGQSIATAPMPDSITATMQAVRELAVLEPAAPVLSVYVCTEPRDPANNASTPSWLIELRNDLRRVVRRSDVEHAPRGERETLGALAEQVEAEARGMPLGKRARGLAWFLTPNGDREHRLALQPAPRSTEVCRAQRPFVSPLIDVADRGRPTGIAVVSAEAVRLLQWEDGRVEEVPGSTFRLDLRPWLDCDADTRSHPGLERGGRYATVDKRVAEWRQRFQRGAAHAAAEQFAARGWSRLLIVGDPQVTRWYADGLPDRARDRG